MSELDLSQSEGLATAIRLATRTGMPGRKNDGAAIEALEADLGQPLPTLWRELLLQSDGLSVDDERTLLGVGRGVPDTGPRAGIRDVIAYFRERGASGERQVGADSVPIADLGELTLAFRLGHPGVHAYDNDGRLSPSTEFDGLEQLVLWLVSCGLARHLEQIVDERADVEDIVASLWRLDAPTENLEPEALESVAAVLEELEAGEMSLRDALEQLRDDIELLD